MMINRYINYYLVLVLFLMPLVVSAGQVKMLEVLFSESEPGIDPYSTRYLLSDDYLRLDDGSDEGDFILFDLKTRVIHSFNHEDKTHLKIEPRVIQAIDYALDFKIKKTPMTQAPAIEGNRRVGYELKANGDTCKHVVSLEGLMPELISVLRDYELVLAEQAKTTLSRVPAAYREPCYMANNYLYVDAYLDGGFPVQVIDYMGKQKKMMSYRPVLKSEQLIQFPQGYRIYKPN